MRCCSTILEGSDEKSKGSSTDSHGSTSSSHHTTAAGAPLTPSLNPSSARSAIESSHNWPLTAGRHCTVSVDGDGALLPQMIAEMSSSSNLSTRDFAAKVFRQPNRPCGGMNNSNMDAAPVPAPNSSTRELAAKLFNGSAASTVNRSATNRTDLSIADDMPAMSASKTNGLAAKLFAQTSHPTISRAATTSIMSNADDDVAYAEKTELICTMRHQIDITGYVQPGGLDTTFGDVSILVDPSNPFDDATVARFIAKLNPPLATYHTYRRINANMPRFNLKSTIDLGQ